MVRIFLLAGIVAVFLFNFCTVSAVALEGLEVQIKSAMIVNFIRFVKWPPSNGDANGNTIVVGVMGADPIMEVLKTQEGKEVDGKTLVIRRIENLKEIPGCHVLFVGGDGSREIDDVVAAVQGFSVLTIGDSEDFCRDGGMIRLFREKNNIRFEINNTAATQANLQLSSKLLEIARVFPGSGKERIP